MPEIQPIPAPIRFGTFEVDPSTGELRKSGLRIKLQEQSFRVLLTLLEHPGKLVTREELKRKLMPDCSFGDFDHAINVAVAKLRATLGDSPDTPRYIETLPRRGYRFVYPVSARETAAVPPPRPEAPATSAATAVLTEPITAGRHLRRWVVLAAIVIIGLVLGLAVGGWLFFSRKSHALTDKDTIVLADFTNTTGDTVFDGTLQQGLAVQLEQSPFLSLVSEQRIQQALRLMGRPADARLTPEIARELCQRVGSAAVLDGSIASLGSQYVLGVKAVNCRTGDTLAEEQVQAARKEDVLKSLSGASAKIREKLGESLASIQKFDTPVEQVTTASLEALKAYSLGMKTRAEKGNTHALPLLRHAVELDPNFAMAYARVGVIYYNMGENDQAVRYTTKAYELRERVSEREKFYIASHYHELVTGDTEQALQIFDTWKQTYPRDYLPYRLMGFEYRETMGQHDKAALEAQEALRLEPNNVGNYVNLAADYFLLNRFDEAKAVIERAHTRQLDVPVLHLLLAELAFVRGDTLDMERQWVSGAKDPAFENVIFAEQAAVQASSGHMAKARELLRTAVESAQRNGLKGAPWRAMGSLAEAYVGNRDRARKEAAGALAASCSLNVQPLAALALAWAGDSTHAQAVSADLAKRYPKNALISLYYVPTIRGVMELNHGNPGGALDNLRLVTPYEAQPCMDAAYARGQAYLASHQGTAAAAEFQKIIDQRGRMNVCPLMSLAHLGLGRARALSSDSVGARTAFQDFFALWKDADPDIPILKQAKAEYANLQ
jgi:DNA-binding winged helix-turn-helix (wHTH) protein/tetratricopeptide (TPR) repeat protein